jgi:hypothetical protein
MSRRNFSLFLLFGVAHMLLGFLLAGAGHGWATGIFFSFLSVIFYPFAGYSLMSDSKKISLFILASNICLSVFMYRSGIKGDDYFLKIWRGVPLLTACYFLLWFGWVGIALLTLLKKRSKLLGIT